MRDSVARALLLKGTFERRQQADCVVREAGDAAVVCRSRDRALVLACPDGCGEILTVNLDPDAGPAWRLYRREAGLSIFPSIWRESGCRSHFVVWRGRILWCDRFEDGNREPDRLSGIAADVRQVLDGDLRSAVEIADVLGHVPWDVTRACRELVAQLHAEEGKNKQRGRFRRAGS